LAHELLRLDGPTVRSRRTYRGGLAGWGALGVSRGGFYAWLRRPPSEHSRTDEALSTKVRTWNAGPVAHQPSGRCGRTRIAGRRINRRDGVAGSQRHQPLRSGSAE
jgi:hypothetical protein